MCTRCLSSNTFHCNLFARACMCVRVRGQNLKFQWLLRNIISTKPTQIQFTDKSKSFQVFALPLFNLNFSAFLCMCGFYLAIADECPHKMCILIQFSYCTQHLASRFTSQSVHRDTYHVFIQKAEEKNKKKKKTRNWKRNTNWKSSRTRSTIILRFFFSSFSAFAPRDSLSIFSTRKSVI